MILDVIGPVIIGPSSSHTAGMARLGRAFRYLFNDLSEGDVPLKVEIYLNSPLFSTYRGHGTDRALIGGVLGIYEWQEELKSSIEIARSKDMSVTFYESSFEGKHPNTIMISGVSKSESHYLIGASTGGAAVEITEIDGARVSISGKYPTLIIKNLDTPGALSKIVTTISMKGINISNLVLVRTNRIRGEAVCIIEMDSEPSKDLVGFLRGLQDVLHVAYLPVLAIP
ncbi:serine dehydratase beta chain [Kosmotoga pacifica]|uniref:L-serine ammonia-lyase n=1 Tax=Kosmotoga pacifica TaxID=1330330 RepID=A0A0G2Z5I8_9BACT|nr:serine dehydratase beta chain [Kosmotoga pacifica]AKI96832.1 hypothetical protein IX53_02230 [Kosmotoga pacifica]